MVKSHTSSERDSDINHCTSEQGIPSQTASEEIFCRRPGKKNLEAFCFYVNSFNNGTRPLQFTYSMSAENSFKNSAINRSGE